ncbi:TonB-dependent siderophore receptor [Methylomonas koyamae]|uniref:Secretin/TonB short N-terminal domain-containing protein n=1 Tax=Methylomonas koyamae TaxID=702114 RepID=A0AA91DBS7_9GAMM|nr:TonB-dependent receptor [Methylomonas koyamae]OAI24966.1 hypothetical protein A1356_14400 [Methylomonas koyamae]
MKHPAPARRSHFFALAAAGLLAPAVTVAADPATQNFDIPSQALSSALTRFSAATGLQVLYEGDIAERITAPELKGVYSPEQALQKMLRGSGLNYRFSNGNTVTLEKKAVVEPQSAAGVTTLPSVTVTGKAYYDSASADNPGYAVNATSTATKTATPVMDTPMSIQVIPKTVLDDQQAYRIADAVKNVSGVQAPFQLGYDGFVVRGFDLTRLEYRNGVRIPLSNFDLANVQAVEVLKGPSSGLYGRIEPGGMINVVTKKPQAEPRYSLNQRFGSYDYYRTEANATGALNADKSLKYRIDLSYLDTKSFRDRMFNDKIFVAPALTWQASAQTEFNFSMEYSYENRPMDGGFPAIGQRVANLPINRTFDYPGTRDTYEKFIADFNWSHEFNDRWKLRNGVTTFIFNEHWNEISAVGLRADKRTNEYWNWSGPRNTQQHSVFLDLTGHFDLYGTQHEVLAGTDYYILERTNSVSSVFLGTVDIYNPVFPPIDVAAVSGLPHDLNSFRQESWNGVYFQDQITLWDKLQIMGGGRYDWASTGNGNASTNVQDAERELRNIDEDYFSPRTGILYRPLPWLSLYGNYVESVGANNGLTADGSALPSQTAQQYEAGIKTELFDGKLLSTIAFFDLTKQNTLTPDPKFRNVSRAIGEARSRGLEIDVSGQIGDAVSVVGSYAYTDSEITKDTDNAGKRLPNAPLHSGSFWLKYAFQQPTLKGFSVGAGVYTASKRWGDAANSYYDDAYARLDLYAAYKQKIAGATVTTQLNINNVTDTRYYSLNSPSFNLPAEPITALGSVRVEF